MKTVQFHYYGKVEDIGEYEQAQFVSDSQDVQAINDYFGIPAGEFDSYFATIQDGDYIRVWGIEGIIPDLNKPCWLICTE